MGMGYLKEIEHNLSRIRADLKEHGWIMPSTITGSKSVEFLKEGDTRCVYIYLVKDDIAYIMPYRSNFQYDNHDIPCKLDYWESSAFSDYAMWFTLLNVETKCIDDIEEDECL